MMRRHTHWALCAALLWLAACAFDDAALDDRAPCEDDTDCAVGAVCFAEVCTPRDLLPEQEADATLDAAEPDVSEDVGEPDAGEPDVGDGDAGNEDTGSDAREDVADDAEDTGEDDADGSTSEDAEDAEDDTDTALVCEPGARTCEGSVAVVCSEDGLSREETDCRLDADCLDARFGCLCEAGLCETRVCRPDAASCDNNTRVQCNAEGTAISVLGACPAGERRAGGLCLPSREGPCAGPRGRRDRAPRSGRARGRGRLRWPRRGVRRGPERGVLRTLRLHARRRPLLTRRRHRRNLRGRRARLPGARALHRRRGVPGRRLRAARLRARRSPLRGPAPAWALQRDR